MAKDKEGQKGSCAIKDRTPAVPPKKKRQSERLFQGCQGGNEESSMADKNRSWAPIRWSCW